MITVLSIQTNYAQTATFLTSTRVDATLNESTQEYVKSSETAPFDTFEFIINSGLIRNTSSAHKTYIYTVINTYINKDKGNRPEYDIVDAAGDKYYLVADIDNNWLKFTYVLEGKTYLTMFKIYKSMADE